MTAETDLLPCPFCGSENIDPKGWASTDSAGPACDDCGAGAGGVRGTLQDNIAAWNRRACVSSATEALRAERDAAIRGEHRTDDTQPTWAELVTYWRGRAQRAEAQAADLREAGARVTAAFRAHGEATPWTRESERTRHECEAAMIALDAALSRAANDTQAGGGGA